jgi:hypothetical protein
MQYVYIALSTYNNQLKEMITIKITMVNDDTFTEEEFNVMCDIIWIIDDCQATIKHVSHLVSTDFNPLVDKLFDLHVLCNNVRNQCGSRQELIRVVDILSQVKTTLEMMNCVLHNPIENKFTHDIETARINTMKIMRHEGDYKKYEE